MESQGLHSKLSRRKFLSIASVTMAMGATMVVAACAPTTAPGASTTNTESTASDTAPSAVPTEITVWGFAQVGEEARAEYASSVLENVQVTMATQDTGGQGAEAAQKFLTAVAAGTTAPVVIFDRFQIASYGHRNAFTALDDYLERDNFDLGRFSEATLRECYGIDGNIYGLPRHFVNRYYFLNTEHFEEAGLDPAAGLPDWQYFSDAGAALTQTDSAGRITQVGVQPTPDTAYTWGWSNGGEWISEDGHTATMNEARNVEAYEFAVGAVDAMGGQEAISAFASSFQSDAGDPFLVGQASMKLNGNTFLRNVALYKPDLKFHTAYYATKSADDPRQSWAAGHAWVIPRGTAEIETAWEIMKIFMSYESNVAFQEAEKAVAAAQNAPYIPMLVGQPEQDTKFAETYQSGVEDIDRAFQFGMSIMTEAPIVHVRPQSPAASEMWDAVKLAQEETLRKSKSADQALTDANNTIQAVLDEAWSMVA